MVHDLLERITRKHKELVRLRPTFSKELEKNLYQWFRVALTYTSNAIEGNTLSELETAQIIEKDVTVPGKTLTEHLEAISHAQAIDAVKQLAAIKTRKEIEIADILAMHRVILQKINKDYAGSYRDIPVRIMGSSLPIPNYQKVPALMHDLINWLHTCPDSIVQIASDAHLKLAYIHPFVDGNGRTARLFMNLILLQDQYPLVYIAVEDRLAYIKAIQKAISYASATFSQEEFVAQSHSLEIPEFQDYYAIIFAAIERSVDEYLNAVQQ